MSKTALEVRKMIIFATERHVCTLGHPLKTAVWAYLSAPGDFLVEI
jgi:hypothetical protein